jgi:hypothetical protein
MQDLNRWIEDFKELATKACEWSDPRHGDRVFRLQALVDKSLFLIKELQEREEKLVAALRSLCPVSLKLALRDLELITNENIEDAELESAKMHVSCELQRMEEAQAALTSLGITEIK